MERVYGGSSGNGTGGGVHWGVYGQNRGANAGAGTVQFPEYVASSTCFQRLFGLQSSNGSSSEGRVNEAVSLSAQELLVNTNDEQLIGKCVRIVGLLAHKPASRVNSSRETHRRSHTRGNSTRGSSNSSSTSNGPHSNSLIEPVCNEHIEINHCGRIIDRRLRVKMFVDTDLILDFDAEADGTDKTDRTATTPLNSAVAMDMDVDSMRERDHTRVEYYEHLVYFNRYVYGVVCVIVCIL